MLFSIYYDILFYIHIMRWRYIYRERGTWKGNQVSCAKALGSEGGNKCVQSIECWWELCFTLCRDDQQQYGDKYYLRKGSHIIRLLSAYYK